jgi:hypothetical protein
MRFKVQRCPGLVVQKVDTLVPRKLVSVRHRDTATRTSLRNPMRQSLQQRALRKQSKQLRILFCGSDEFSSASLRALHDLQHRKPGLVKSIDVMIRPGKPSGRSLKTIRDGKRMLAMFVKMGLTDIASSSNQSRCSRTRP